METILQLQQKLKAGGEKKYHDKNTEAGKLFARERIRLLCDKDSFVEDGLFANCMAEGLPADAVVTGFGLVGGRKVAVLANDSTVKAGSWGARTVEKMIRLQEMAEKLKVPVFYLVDSAGARITDQIEMFPGRRGAGRIFYNQARLSGQVPQICLLFGPSAAGGAYIPSFCDVLFMVEGNASMYLGSPRMAESVIGEKVTLEEMGGAKMHCTVSGVGDFLMASEQEAIEKAKKYLSYFPQNEAEAPQFEKNREPEKPTTDLEGLIPKVAAKAYDMKEALKTVVDSGSFFEIKELYAKEVITGLCRINGQSVGIIANQPLVKGGVLFVESSNKAARFIQLCSSYSIPILFVSDVPGFMIGSKTEREGMIRAGAKLIYALSNARVPKICLIIRKAFGAGLYAMAGPSFGSDCVIALPSAQVAVMGPEPAIQAVYAGKMAEMDEVSRKKFLLEKMAEYEKDIDIKRLAGELIIDQLIDYTQLRSEIVARFKLYTRAKDPLRPPGIMPM